MAPCLPLNPVSPMRMASQQVDIVQILFLNVSLL